MKTSNQRTKNSDDVPYFNIRHDVFKNSFLPSAVIEWNKLDSRLRKVTSFTDFKKNSFIRPKANSAFNCNSSKGLKLVTRLRQGLSHLREHKFKHSFQDSKIALALVVWMLNQLFTISFTALYSQSKDTLLNTIVKF